MCISPPPPPSDPQDDNANVLTLDRSAPAALPSTSSAEKRQRADEQMTDLLLNFSILGTGFVTIGSPGAGVSKVRGASLAGPEPGGLGQRQRRLINAGLGSTCHDVTPSPKINRLSDVTNADSHLESYNLNYLS